jgi:hypothetical protein
VVFPRKKAKRERYSSVCGARFHLAGKGKKKLKKNKSVKGTQIKAELFQPPKNEPLEA